MSIQKESYEEAQKRWEKEGVEATAEANEIEQKTYYFHNSKMEDFCRNECPFKKQNCQHNCSLAMYAISQKLTELTGEEKRL